MTKKEEANVPNQPVKKLVISVSLLVVAGLLILVLQILPAQFGIDLTGFGTYIGLTKRYEAKQYYAELKNTTERQDTDDVEVAAGEDLEYKVYMLEGDQIEFRWTAGEGEVFFEFHGEPGGVRTANYKSYSSDTVSESSGTFKASFEGTHGWYWRNDSSAPVTITVETDGKYSNVGIRAVAFSRKK